MQVDPDQLAAHGIGIDEVQRAIAASNTNLPTGRLDGDKQAFTIESSGTLPQRRGLPAHHRGLAQRLARCGWSSSRNVIDSVDNDKLVGLVQRPSARVILAIQRQPGTNTVEVVDNIRALLPAVPPRDSAGRST